jgi:hypothetical protein
MKRCWESHRREPAPEARARGDAASSRPRRRGSTSTSRERRAVRLVQLHGGSRGQAARAQVELRRVVEIVGNTVAVRLVDHDGVGHARRPRSLRSMPSASGGRMLRTTTAAATNEPTELHFTAGFIMLQTKLTCSSDANTVNDNDAFVCDGNVSLTCSPFPTSI